MATANAPPNGATAAATAAAAAAAAEAAKRNAASAELLCMVLGPDVVGALREGFLNGGDFTGVVPLLVGAGAKPHLAAAARGALAAACNTGRADVALLLLGADGIRPADADLASDEHVDRDGYRYSGTLLSAAVHRGDEAVVRALVASGKADVNLEGSGLSPLTHAAQCGNTACVHALLTAPGIDVNKLDRCGDTALITAATNGHTACARALLVADGIDVNFATVEGDTALVMAAYGGHTACARALLAAPGIDANVADAGGDTALTCAIRHGHVLDAECFHAFLAADGLDVNHANEDGMTALLLAAFCNSTACVRALVAAKGLDHRARASCTATVAKTALHHACTNTNAEMVALLLVAGSCRFAADAAGRTALDLARGPAHAAVRAVFASGVDYWQRGRHGVHA